MDDCHTTALRYELKAISVKFYLEASGQCHKNRIHNELKFKLIGSGRKLRVCLRCSLWIINNYFMSASWT